MNAHQYPAFRDHLLQNSLCEKFNIVIIVEIIVQCSQTYHEDVLVQITQCAPSYQEHQNTMPPTQHAGQKRKLADRLPKKAHRPRKFKKTDYHSSSDSEDEVEPVRNDILPAEIDLEIDGASDDSLDAGVELPNLDTTSTGIIEKDGDIVPPSRDEDNDMNSDDNEEASEEDDILPTKDEVDLDGASDTSAASDSELSDDNATLSDTETASTQTRERRLQNRNDPTVFAASLSRILSTKLTSTQRTDPILSRSASAATNLAEQAEARLTAKAKRKLRDEKRTQGEKGRVKDVLGVERVDVDTGGVVGKEKELRRTAQRGVVKLFNAVRAAQVMGLEAEKGEKVRGTIGMEKRKDVVGSLGKKAFLDLLVEGGGGAS